MDNASFHKSTKTRALIEKTGCVLLYLPPYSPDLNPIEQFWAYFKTESENLFICLNLYKTLLFSSFVMYVFERLLLYFSSFHQPLLYSSAPMSFLHSHVISALPCHFCTPMLFLHSHVIPAHSHVIPAQAGIQYIILFLVHLLITFLLKIHKIRNLMFFNFMFGIFLFLDSRLRGNDMI